MNEPNPEPSSPGRIAALDSLRGLAALVVVFYHLSLVVPGDHYWLEAIWPLRILVAGPQAVLIFFVLSGFVLYLSLERHDREGWLTFAARRTLRLYPPVAAAIILSVGLYLLVDTGPAPRLSGWITRYSWTEYPSITVIVGHLLLFDSDRFHMLDNPIWSLVVEIRLSLIFPLIAAGIRARPVVTLVICLVIALFSRCVLNTGHQVTIVDLPSTLQFIDLFAIGAAMARYIGSIGIAFYRIPPPLVVVLTLIALCWRHRFDYYLAEAGAVSTVAMSFAYPRLARLYAHKPFIWLGERSFSLYLVHVPLLLTAFHLLYGRMSVVVVAAGTLPLCLTAAELFWLLVERPCQRISRRFRHRPLRSPQAVSEADYADSSSALQDR